METARERDERVALRRIAQTRRYLDNAGAVRIAFVTCWSLISLSRFLAQPPLRRAVRPVASERLADLSLRAST